MQVLKPIVYYEAGKRQQGYPFINEAFTDRALYNMLAETTCRNFKAKPRLEILLQESRNITPFFIFLVNFKKFYICNKNYISIYNNIYMLVI